MQLLWKRMLSEVPVGLAGTSGAAVELENQADQDQW